MGDTYVFCTQCRLPIIDRGDGRNDPTAGDRPMHTKCRVAYARATADEAVTASLALRVRTLIRSSGLKVAIDAWEQAVEALKESSYTQDDLRDLVQRVIIVLLLKHDARHAALQRELETLFGNSPNPVRAAS